MCCAVLAGFHSGETRTGGDFPDCVFPLGFVGEGVSGAQATTRTLASWFLTT